MKHIIVIETVTPIGPFQVDDLRHGVEHLADHLFGDNNFCQIIANQPSAIRGVYRLYGADENRSPNEHRSATEESYAQ